MRCVVESCFNNQRFKNKLISFHRFPQILDMKCQWICALGLKASVVNTRTVVCSDHFYKNDYFGETRQLFPSAVPHLAAEDEKMSLLAVSQLPRRCRACLECVDEQAYVDLEAPFFDCNDDDEETEAHINADIISTNMLEVFNDCTQLQVRLDDEENLQSEWEACRYLCAGCCSELKSAHHFIAKAKMSNMVLRDKLSLKTDIKETIVDDDKDLELIETLDDDSDEPEEPIKNALETLIENTNSQVEQALAAIFGIGSCEEDINNQQLNYASDDEKKIDLSGSLLEDMQELENNDENDLEENAHFSETSMRNANDDDEDEDDATSVVVHLVETDQEDDVVEAEEELQHMLEFKCELCMSKFDFQRDLVMHYALDHDEKDLHFPCNTCEQRLFSKSSLNVHIRQIHQNCEYLDCYLCGRTVLKSFFKVHLKRHTTKQKFLCPECPSTFTSRYTQKKHLQIHAKNRNRDFECDVCARKFYTIESFRTHQITHQDPKQRDIYSCSLCTKTFMRQTNLKLHMQMHRGETMDCPHCGKKFVRRKDMEIHIRFHTGEFPYACKTCGKRFAITGHLKAHEQKHKGIKYKCIHCDKEFLHVAGLKQHAYEHTGMPLCCGICQKGFPTKFKVRRHIRSVHHNLFATGYKDDEAEQYVKQCEVQQLPKKEIVEIAPNAEEDDENFELEMLEEDEEYLAGCLIEEI